MQPAMTPAMEQATATVMQPRPPASSEFRIMEPVSFNVRPTTDGFLSVAAAAASLLRLISPGKLTRIASRMAMEAEY